MKFSNKVILVSGSFSKSSFTSSKLRFFKLRLPKNLSCYKTSTGSKGIQFRLDTFFVRNNIKTRHSPEA